MMAYRIATHLLRQPDQEADHEIYFIDVDHIDVFDLITAAYDIAEPVYSKIRPLKFHEICEFVIKLRFDHQVWIDYVDAGRVKFSIRTSRADGRALIHPQWYDFPRSQMVDLLLRVGMSVTDLEDAERRQKQFEALERARDRAAALNILDFVSIEGVFIDTDERVRAGQVLHGGDLFACDEGWLTCLNKSVPTRWVISPKGRAALDRALSGRCT